MEKTLVGTAALLAIWLFLEKQPRFYSISVVVRQAIGHICRTVHYLKRRQLVLIIQGSRRRLRECVDAKFPFSCDKQAAGPAQRPSAAVRGYEFSLIRVSR
jgi:hypothetical protein